MKPERAEIQAMKRALLAAADATDLTIPRIEPLSVTPGLRVAPGKTKPPLSGDGTEPSAASFPIDEAPDWPSPIREDALIGPAGDFVRLVDPCTEASSPAILIQFLAAAGCLFGPTSFFRVGADRHPPKLFVCLVGSTSSGKGVSLAEVLNLIRDVEPKWGANRIQSGLSTGEGLIAAASAQPASSKPSFDPPDPPDMRLLVKETEFARTMEAARRDRNTLSAIVRDAWDTDTLQTMTKTNPARVTGAHISIVGHITPEEINRVLPVGSFTNGFVNRFLWVCTKLTKYLPIPPRVSEVELTRIREALRRAVAFAREERELQMDEEATAIWMGIYPKLKAFPPGRLGDVLQRVAPQVMRLGLIYALLDESPTIQTKHLKAALEVWRYCSESARYIFTTEIGDKTQDAILAELREAGARGLSRTEISNLFKRNKDRHEIDRALSALFKASLARKALASKRGGNLGRGEERWFFDG